MRISLGLRVPSDFPARSTTRANRAPFRGRSCVYVNDVNNDWRSASVQNLRSLILLADPDIVEEAKWRKPSNPDGVPTFSRDGIVCTVETYKDKVKLTFAKGASLEDPSGLFNASLTGGTRRAIDLPEGAMVEKNAFVDLIREAVALNQS